MCVCVVVVVVWGGTDAYFFELFSIYKPVPVWELHYVWFCYMHVYFFLALIIYGKDEDFSRRFRDNPNFLVDTDDFLLQRNNDSFEAVFPSGICIVRSIAYLWNVSTSIHINFETVFECPTHECLFISSTLSVVGEEALETKKHGVQADAEPCALLSKLWWLWSKQSGGMRYRRDRFLPEVSDFYNDNCLTECEQYIKLCLIIKMGSKMAKRFSP